MGNVVNSFNFPGAVLWGPRHWVGIFQQNEQETKTNTAYEYIPRGTNSRYQEEHCHKMPRLYRVVSDGWWCLILPDACPKYRPVHLFNDVLSVAHIEQRRMRGLYWIGNDVEGKVRYSPDICLEGPRKTSKKTQSWGLQAKIGTRDPTNTKEEWSRLVLHWTDETHSS